MLAADSTVTAVLEWVGAPILVLTLAAISRAVAQWYKEHRQLKRDNESVSQFLFDQPENPRTHTPFRKGWTTKVDERLKDHDSRLGGAK